MENALQSLQIFYIILLRAKIVTTFGSKMVTISTREYKNVENLRTSQGYISVFYNISRPNFGILLLLKGSFREFCFFVLICPDPKLVYDANCPFKLDGFFVWMAETSTKIYHVSQSHSSRWCLLFKHETDIRFLLSWRWFRSNMYDRLFLIYNLIILFVTFIKSSL